MFDLSDWNDSSEAQSLTESVQRSQDNAAAARETAPSSRKKRLKRTRQLMEILRTLETPGPLMLGGPPAVQEPPPRVIPKKRRKEQDPSGASDTSPQNVGLHPNSASTEEHISRQRWRNRQKNKKKKKNKFKTEDEGLGERTETLAGAGERTQRVPGVRGKTQTAAGEGERTQRVAEEGEMTRGASGPNKSVTDSLSGVAKPGARKLVKRSKQKSNGEELEETTKSSEDTPKVSRLLESGSSPLGARVTPLQKRRLQKLKKLLETKDSGKGGDPLADGEQKDGSGAEVTNEPQEVLPEDRSASLRSRMEQRLSAARFRYINEQLYTSDSHEAQRLFQMDPEAFTVYHEGFSQQVQHWPANPINEIIKYIKNRPASLVVADFGCGDALLARSVRNKVHSFDLVALNKHVTVCDIAKVPLSDETVDIAVFCLSLMGKNLSEFLQEANRVLKLGGVLLVAEVSSRFDDVRSFLSAMTVLGYKNVSKSTDNGYFFIFEFCKSAPSKACTRHPGLELSPCLYKKR
ncbi:ribosomal RNA-processing protein 8 [Discoglossus pictus]